MADVLFYVLNSDTPEALEAFVGKLLHKILKEQRLCDLRLESETDLQRWDQNLWHQPPESFLAHSAQKALPAPIQLWTADIAQPTRDVLLNLHPKFPVLHPQYQRTIEVLDQSTHLVERGRQRWKQYKQAGIEPTLHKIGFPKST